MVFETEYEKILERIEKIDPVLYASNRNYLDGSVSYLSPYISRGVISTKFIFEHLLKRGFDFQSAGKFIQELAWRDYWQQIWIHKKEAINKDLKSTQLDVLHFNISKNIIKANTEIEAIDDGINNLYQTGYMHNHMRMYVASLACNIAKNHWHLPAQWMYYHLLDADWASNALSWQWVAGSNSNKKYFANQDNINNFCKTNQWETYLDVEYEAFKNFSCPPILKENTKPNLTSKLPEPSKIAIESKDIQLYNFYNLDPTWEIDLDSSRVLLLEPSHFEAYPVSERTIQFVLDLSYNIPGIQVYAGEFHELQKENPEASFHFKEHPLNSHYEGREYDRDWMFDIQGYYPSFFNFWKRCKKSYRV